MNYNKKTVKILTRQGRGLTSLRFECSHRQKNRRNHQRHQNNGSCSHSEYLLENSARLIVCSSWET